MALAADGERDFIRQRFPQCKRMVADLQEVVAVLVPVRPVRHRCERPEIGAGLIRKLERIYVHPEYQGTNFDLAILKLNETVIYNAAIRPVCFPEDPGRFCRPRNNVQKILRFTVSSS